MADREYSYDVFISYGRGDHGKVATIRKKLEGLGLSVFLDTEGVEAGSDFPAHIDGAIRRSKSVLACWTPDALRRRWVRAEGRMALDLGTLIAAVLTPIEPTNLPVEFYNVSVVDLSTFTGQDEHTGWLQIVRSVSRRIESCDRAQPRAPRGGASAVRARTPSGPSEFAPRLRAAQEQLSISIPRRIEDVTATPDPRSIWTTAQVIASSPKLPDNDFARYAKTIHSVIQEPGGCVLVDGIPHTASSMWIALSFVRNDAQPPEHVVTSLLDAQKASGWWTSALDADDNESNASVYVTSLVAIGLDAIEFQVQPSVRDRLRTARKRATAWLSSARPQRGQQWSDYPNNPQRTEEGIFSSMAVVALLNSTLSEKASVAAGHIESLVPVVNPATNFSTDVVISRRANRTYTDTCRHVSYGWQVWALARSYDFVRPKHQAVIRRQLSVAAQKELNSSALIRQAWWLAEIVYGLENSEKYWGKL